MAGTQKGKGTYTSTKALLPDHMEVVANAKHAKERATFYVWLGWISGELQLEDWSTEVV